MFSAQFNKDGKLVGIALTNSVGALNQIDFTFVTLPDFFDPSTHYIQGVQSNFSIREIPSLKAAQLLEQYSPAHQISLMRKALCSLAKTGELTQEFLDYAVAMEDAGD